MDESVYLKSASDDLPTRESRDYARYKLDALRHYLTMAFTAMRNKP